MTTTHPPVPPNCPYFLDYRESLREEERGWHFQMFSDQQFWYDGPATIQLNYDDIDKSVKDFWMPIIAAVAEVAWREIADKKSLAGAGKRAAQNACAWRAWGKGEWKP